ncbi:MAG: ATPase, T2SS/T4P/T4SS family [Planctomycetota bacterium]
MNLPARLKDRLIKILIEQMGCPGDRIKEAQTESLAGKGDLIELILLRKDATEEQVFRALAQMSGLEFREFDPKALDSEVVETISKEVALEHDLVVIGASANGVTVALSNPFNVRGVDRVEEIVRRPVLPVVSTPSRIREAIQACYEPSAEIELGDPTLDLRHLTDEVLADPDRLQAVAGENPIVQVVDQVFRRALEDGASDIHIEPRELKLRVRLRVDGVLQELVSLPRELISPVCSRIKVLAGLNIAEKRKPLDGVIVLTLGGGRKVELRVSSLPTIYGEKIVCRVFDRSRQSIELDKLGFSPDILSGIKQILASPYGMVYVTGPTGSGKSTTLSGMLSYINSSEINIVTVEDPVEYRLQLVNQVHVDARSGRSFADSLRAILRQDPDVVMIGETRDQETATIAIQAALTGHLVLSTLHTNTAIQAIPRLLNIGVQPFLIGPSLLAVLAQRLVRKVCTECAEVMEPDPGLLESMGFEELIGSGKFRSGPGCDHCRGTGYRGRIGVHSLLLVVEEIRELIYKRATDAEIQEAAERHGHRELWVDAMRKALLGLTSIDEVMRVTSQV